MPNNNQNITSEELIKRIKETDKALHKKCWEDRCKGVLNLMSKHQDAIDINVVRFLNSSTNTEQWLGICNYPLYKYVFKAVEHGYTNVLSRFADVIDNNVRALEIRNALLQNHNPNHYNLLMYACNKLNKESVKYLLEQGVDPNIKDGDGQTAAMYLIDAAQAGDAESCLELLEELIIHNADLSLVDNNKLGVLWGVVDKVMFYGESWNECQKFIINTLKYSNNDALLTQVKGLKPGPSKKAVMKAAGFNDPTILVIMVEDLMRTKPGYFNKSQYQLIKDLLLRVDQETIQSLPDKIFQEKVFERQHAESWPMYTECLLQELTPDNDGYKVWSSRDIKLLKLLIIANADISQYENFVNNLRDISRTDTTPDLRTNAVILTETKKEILDLITASKCLVNYKTIGRQEKRIEPLIKQLAWDRLCFLIQSNNVQRDKMKVKQLQQLAKYIKDNDYQEDYEYDKLLTCIIEKGLEEYIPIIASSMKDPNLAYNIKYYAENFLNDLDIVTLEVEKILDSDSVNDSVLPRGLALGCLPTQYTDLNNIDIAPVYTKVYKILKQLKWFQNVISKLDSTQKDNQDNNNPHTIKYYQEHPEALIPGLRLKYILENKTTELQEKLLETYKKVFRAVTKVKYTANELLSLIDFEKSVQYKHILKETHSNKEMVQSKEKLSNTLKDCKDDHLAQLSHFISLDKEFNLIPQLYRLCHNSLYSIPLTDKAKQMLNECISKYHDIDFLIADTYEVIIATEMADNAHDDTEGQDNCIGGCVITEE